MARMVATKTALSVRIDALSDADTKSAEDAPIAGIEHRVKLESRLRALEQGMGITSIRRQNAGTSMNQQPRKFDMRGAGASYNASADTLIPSQPPISNVTNGTHSVIAAMQVGEPDEDGLSPAKKEKKRKRQAASEFEAEAADAVLAAPAEITEEDEKKERKKRKKEAKLAANADSLVGKAAAEIGAVPHPASTTGGSMNGNEKTLEESERKRLKKEKKMAKKAGKAT